MTKPGSEPQRKDACTVAIRQPTKPSNTCSGFLAILLTWKLVHKSNVDFSGHGKIYLCCFS